MISSRVGPDVVLPPAAPPLSEADQRCVPTLGQLLFLPLDQFAFYSTGFVNLLCATGLPDTADLDVHACLVTLDHWTHIVRRETDRQTYRFHSRPDDFENSEAYFRVLVMVTVLQRDLKVRYDHDSIKTQQFKNSREGFIHGLLTGSRTGTCANMPVLCAAVGRCLGYPIYLCQAKGHMFCRWHDARTGERFNIEASGHGLTTHADDHYLTWPRQIDPRDVHSGLYLRNLSPVEEVATFMATRGHCLLDRGHLLDAIIAYSHAHRLDPTYPHYMVWLMEAINEELEARATRKLPGTYREAESQEFFNVPGVLPVKRYVLPGGFERIVGVND